MPKSEKNKDLSALARTLIRDEYDRMATHCWAYWNAKLPGLTLGPVSIEPDGGTEEAGGHRPFVARGALDEQIFDESRPTSDEPYPEFDDHRDPGPDIDVFPPYFEFDAYDFDRLDCLAPGQSEHEKYRAFELFDLIFSYRNIGEIRSIDVGDVEWIGEMVRAAFDAECTDFMRHLDAKPLKNWDDVADDFVRTVRKAWRPFHFRGFPVFGHIITAMRRILDWYEAGGDVSHRPDYDEVAGRAGVSRCPCAVSVQTGFRQPFMRFGDGSSFHLVKEGMILDELVTFLARPFGRTHYSFEENLYFVLADSRAEMVGAVMYPHAGRLEIVGAEGRRVGKYWGHLENLKLALCIVADGYEMEDLPVVGDLIQAGVPDCSRYVLHTEGNLEEMTTVWQHGLVHFRGGVISDLNDEPGFVGERTTYIAGDIEREPLEWHFEEGLPVPRRPR